MKNKYYVLLIILLSSILFSIQGSATIITFKAEGTENIPENYNEELVYDSFLNDSAANFFNITFNDGNSNEFISEIKINLGAGGDNDAIFDPSDGVKEAGVNDNGGGKGFGPVVGAGLLDGLDNVIAGTGTTGLIPENVMFNLSTTSGSSQELVITFINEDFNPNDILSFGIDIDFLGAGPDITNQRGGLFGSESVEITTFLSGTCENMVSSTFSKESENRSVSRVDICAPVNSVSEPNILLLILSGLGLVSLFQITRLE